MKALSKFALLIFLLLISFAFETDVPVLKTRIKNGVLQIGKLKLSKEWQLVDLQKELGKSEREREGYNKTYTYDNKGIVLFNPKNSTLVSEIQFFLNIPEETNEVTPKGVYTGELKVDKLKVTAGLTPAVMKKALKKWADTDSYMEHSFRKELKGMYMYFQFNESETGLVKLSVGLVKK